MDRDTALRHACDALRAADMTDTADRLARDVEGVLPEALDVLASVTRTDARPVVAAALSALCALRCVLDGYRVTRADEPPDPPPPHT